MGAQMVDRKQTPLKLTEFGVILDAYGGDPRRWPTDRRAAMLATLANNGGAWVCLREARALDMLLNQLAALQTVPSQRYKNGSRR